VSINYRDLLRRLCTGSSYPLFRFENSAGIDVTEERYAGQGVGNFSENAPDRVDLQNRLTNFGFRLKSTQDTLVLRLTNFWQLTENRRFRRLAFDWSLHYFAHLGFSLRTVSRIGWFFFERGRHLSGVLPILVNLTGPLRHLRPLSHKSGRTIAARSAPLTGMSPPKGRRALIHSRIGRRPPTEDCACRKTFPAGRPCCLVRQEQDEYD
jgi:hypothetical protein